MSTPPEAYYESWSCGRVWKNTDGGRHWRELPRPGLRVRARRTVRLAGRRGQLVVVDRRVAAQPRERSGSGGPPRTDRDLRILDAWPLRCGSRAWKPSRQGMRETSKSGKNVTTPKPNSRSACVHHIQGTQFSSMTRRSLTCTRVLSLQAAINPFRRGVRTPKRITKLRFRPFRVFLPIARGALFLSGRYHFGRR
jgi:hypothetical protein